MRKFWESMVWTKDGDLDLGWFLVAILSVAGVVAFLIELLTGKRASLASWSFLGSALSMAMIASIPIARARILATSKLPGLVAEGIASAKDDPGIATDVQELRARGVTPTPTDDKEIG